MDLTSLRQTLRERRRRLTFDECTLLSKQLTARLIQQEHFINSQHIACYSAFDGEVQTQNLIDTIIASGKQCYLPMMDNLNKSLHFFEYQKGDTLTPNRFGILEPKAKRGIAAANLELVLLPLVAFDNQGHRLGTGGGYYDRCFAFIKQTPQPHLPLLIGLAYEWQRVEQLPTQPWDVDMDAIITDQHYYSISKDMK